MKVTDLSELAECINARPSEGHFILSSGVHDVVQTLQISRSGVRIEGEGSPGSPPSILRRGRLADGSLFAGPLVKGDNVSEIELSNLLVNGGRFEDASGGITDNRHPLTPNRESPLYCCAVRCAPPKAYRHELFFTPFETDLSFLGCRNVSVRNVTLQNPIKFGIGLGDGTRGVAIENVRVKGGGNGGIWCGLTSLAGRPSLPLDDAVERLLPRDILIRDSTVEDCGASGIYLEAAEVCITGCELNSNHADYPFNEEGGQLEIDYKSSAIEVSACAIVNAPGARRTIMKWHPERGGWQPEDRIFRAVGIEAFGQDLRFHDNRIEGNSHEGIHLNGASRVRIIGANTRIRWNHRTAAAPADRSNESLQNLSVTTLAEYEALRAVAGDLVVEGIQCENGIMFWSDGSVPDLTVDRVVVRNCDLRGEAGSGVIVANNTAGHSIRGKGWQIEANLE